MILQSTSVHMGTDLTVIDNENVFALVNGPVLTLCAKRMSPFKTRSPAMAMIMDIIMMIIETFMKTFILHTI